MVAKASGKKAADSKLPEQNQVSDSRFPLRKFMQQESSQVYAKLQPFARIPGLLALLIVFIIINCFAFFFLPQINVPLLAIILAEAFFLFIPFLAAIIEAYYLPNTFRFSLQKDYLFIRKGTINPTYELMPYENIQDAVVLQGLTDRLIGTSSINVSTPASPVAIRYVKREQAEKFREDLLSLVHAHKGMTE